MIWQCKCCGYRIRPIKAVGEDGEDWPAGRACSQCGKGEMACSASDSTIPQKHPEDKWRNVAMRIGESLASNGPEDYYELTADQWLEWAEMQLLTSDEWDAIGVARASLVLNDKGKCAQEIDILNKLMERRNDD